MRDRVLGVILVASLIINLVMWGAVYWILLPAVSGQVLIPLHYNIYFDADDFGAAENAFGIPFFGLAVIVINAISAGIALKKAKLPGYLLLGGACITQMILAGALFLIIRFNV